MLSHPHPWTPDPQHSFLELLLCVRLQRAPGKLWVMRPGFCPPANTRPSTWATLLCPSVPSPGHVA